MAKVLITGVDSFVGRNFIRYSHNKEVAELSLMEKQPEEKSFVGYDVVLHLVAIVHQSSKISEKEYIRINKDLCLETARVAKKAGVKHFIFLSTVKVYGEYDAEFGLWTENSACFPTDPYGKSKYEAENELKKMEDGNFTVSIVRTPLVYGRDVRANMLSIMKLVDRMKILPFKNVQNKRSFTYTKNLVGFIDRIIEKKASGVFIAMDSRYLSTTELVLLITKYLNRKLILFKIPAPFVRIGIKLIPRIFERLFGSFELDNRQTLEQLDFTPQYSTEEGLMDMVEAYLEKKDME